MKAKTVSVIILTKNAGRYIREQLEAIFGQEGVSGLEVVIVDSGSRDDTLAIVSRYPTRVMEISPEEFNHGETRNFGARESAGEQLVFLTQDATPAGPRWLANLLGPLERDRSVAGAFSRHIPRPGCSLPLARQLEEDWPQGGGKERIVKRVASREEFETDKAFYSYFANTSSCLRRSVWEEFPFRDVEFGEDADWAERVLVAGYAIVYEPTSAVYHSHDYSLKEQLRQHFDYGRFIRSSRLAPPITLRRTAKTFLVSLREDSSYIRREGLPCGAVFSCVPFHAACVLGRWMGEHSKRMPGSLVAALSRQRNIQIN